MKTKRYKSEGSLERRVRKAVRKYSLVLIRKHEDEGMEIGYGAAAGKSLDSPLYVYPEKFEEDWGEWLAGALKKYCEERKGREKVIIFDGVDGCMPEVKRKLCRFFVTGFISDVDYNLPGDAVMVVLMDERNFEMVDEISFDIHKLGAIWSRGGTLLLEHRDFEGEIFT